MEVSRLSFSKKTQDKMNKKISGRRKGEILFNRLEEMDNDGTLSRAKNRADVATLVGYPNERAKAGYSWVSNLIARGHLTETVREWTPSGTRIAEYHLTGVRPKYGYEERADRAKRKEAGQELYKTQNTTEKKQALRFPKVIEITPAEIPIKIEITKGDIVLKVEFVEVEQATNLIAAIMRGE